MKTLQQQYNEVPPLVTIGFCALFFCTGFLGLSNAIITGNKNAELVMQKRDLARHNFELVEQNKDLGARLDRAMQIQEALESKLVKI